VRQVNTCWTSHTTGPGPWLPPRKGIPSACQHELRECDNRYDRRELHCDPERVHDLRKCGSRGCHADLRRGSTTADGAGDYSISVPTAGQAHYAVQYWQHVRPGATRLLRADGQSVCPELRRLRTTGHTFGDVPVPGKEWMEPWIVAFFQHGVTTAVAGATTARRTM